MSEAAAFDINLALNSMYIIGTITSWACKFKLDRADQSSIALVAVPSISRDSCSWAASLALSVFSAFSRPISMPRMVSVFS